MPHKTLKSAIIVLISIIIVVIIAVGAYYFAALYIKEYGIELKPSQTIEPKNVEFFLQNDPEWKDDRLGDTDHYMNDSGCLVSAIASSISYLGIPIDPKKLNEIFNENKIYTQNGDIIWYKINEAIPEVDYSYSRVFFSSTIENDLKNDLLPIVKVKYHKTGIYHWVLITGSDGDDFLIMDPLYQSKQFAKLEEHGKVYAYRVLK